MNCLHWLHQRWWNFVTNLHATSVLIPNKSKMFCCGGMSTNLCICTFLIWHLTTLQFQVRNKRVHLNLCWLFHNHQIATSTDVEHVFSQGRILLSRIHNWLSSQSTWALVCLGSLSMLGYVKDNDIMAVTVQPEVAGDEEDLPAGWDAIMEA